MNILPFLILGIIAIVLIGFAIKTTFKIVKIILMLVLLSFIICSLLFAYLSYVKPPVISEPIKEVHEMSAIKMLYKIIKESKEMHNDNINTVSFSPWISDYGPDGKIEKRYFSKTITIITTGTARHYKFRVHLALDSNARGNLLEKKGKKEINDTTAFLANLEPIVLYYAEYANKTKIEYFTPFMNLGCVVGKEKADAWYSKILPEIQKRYSGEIIAKNEC